MKSRSTIFNSVEMNERALRLATTLLPPNVCYIIAYLTSALNNIQYSVGEDISTQDFFPLSSPDYVSPGVPYHFRFLNFHWSTSPRFALGG